MTLSNADPTAVPNLGSRSCHAGTAGAFTYVIGMPVAGRTIEDGSSSVKVECLVRLEGADAQFSVTGSGVDDNGKKPVSFSLGGQASPASATAGSMSFFSPDTAGLATTETFPCLIGPVTTVKRGALLTDFACPFLASPDDTTSACQVRGTIALEYCKTGEEEDR